MPAELPKGRLYCIHFKKECGRVDSNHHGIATASPSSWCVCQFRHDRAVLILSAEDLLCQTIGRIPTA